MTIEEKKIKVAEKCGYSYCIKCGKYHDANGIAEIPDYPNDLDAIAEAVNSMPRHIRSIWPMKLRAIVVRDNAGKEDPDTGLLDDTYFYNATAPQRFEALGHAWELWKEGE